MQRFFTSLIILIISHNLILPIIVYSQTVPMNSNLVVVGHINSCIVGPTGGTANTYACSVDYTLAAPLQTKACFSFIPDVSNTGASTINYNGTGAKPIVKMAGGIATPLIANDIRAGQIVVTCFDGTSMQMMSQVGNAATGDVPSTRAIATTAPLAGGGDLSANRTFTCPTCTTSAAALTSGLPVIGQGAQATAVGTRSGNQTEFATTVPGAKAANQQLAFDASGNVIASGTAIGSGGGVTTDTAQRAAFYNSTTTVDGATALTFDATGATITSTAPRITTVNASKTLDTTDGSVVACTGGATDLTLTLPAGAATTQREWTIVKVDAGVGRCLVQGSGGTETLNGATTAQAIASQHDRLDLILDQTTGTPNWSASVSKNLFNLAADVTGRLPYANLTAPTSFPKLLGRGDTGGDWQEISVGTNLTMSGTQLNASGGAGGYATIQDEGTARTQRSTVNFTGTGITCTDNAGSTRTDCDVPGGGASAPVVAQLSAASGTVTAPNVGTAGAHVIFDRFDISGTLTIPAPAGTAQPGQPMLFRLKPATTPQTLSFTSGVAGGFCGVAGAALPTLTGDSSTYVEYGFTYNAFVTPNPCWVFDGGTRQTGKLTLIPDATNPGLNVGSFAGDPSTPLNADLWYNSTTNTLRAQINGTTVSLGAGSSTKTIEIPAAAMAVQGACALNPEAALVTNGPRLVTIGCTNATADTVEFDFIPDNWNGGTITAELVAFSLGNNNAETLRMDWAFQCVSSGDTPTAHSTTGEQATIITWGNAANREQRATSAAITGQGACAAGDHIYMRGHVNTATTMTPMTDLRILGVRIAYSAP